MAKKNKKKNIGFFNLALMEKWRADWLEMPEYQQNDLEPMQTISVHFSSVADRDLFSRAINQTITAQTRYIFFPPVIKEKIKGFAFCKSDTPQNPQYPVYIISKGRWKSRYTARYLESIRVPYSIVIEPQEYDQYAAVIDPEKILVLPFSNLGQGSIPARNWVWEHALSLGAARHWILDDNIRAFQRMYKNRKYYVTDGTIFKVIEDFVDRYENIGLAGMQYAGLFPRRLKRPAFALNTRIYSCILIDNSLPFRWRGKYNEDTDLSLRVLKSGLCTVLFYAFLCEKNATMRMSGGNTDELYKGDGRLKMAESLVEQHPDVTRITQRWGRSQHIVDYTPFQNIYKNKLKLKKGVELSDEINNYGMECIFTEEVNNLENSTSANDMDESEENE